jgi:hypothetical protein
MIKAVAVAILFVTGAPGLPAQNKPRSLHIQGPQARRLVSLLVSGSDSIASSFQGGATQLVLHDLLVLKFATYKYDGDGGMYNLDVYSAEAKIGDAGQTTRFTEATGLYELLSSLGVKPQLSMQGSDLDASTVDCRVNTHQPFEKPQRFVCDLTLPF